ncbi:MAG TPA: hypothetical protein VGK17_17305, partial [Propionicimonas sp.]
GCTIACLPGWADCDPLIPGCETNTNLSNDHCGKCARKCAPANADAFACEEGLCVVKTCTSGYTDCDTNPWNGCEIHTSADPTHCGTCSTQCTVNHGVAACNNGQCAIGSCTSPWLNCDGAYATGCNINKETDPDNCGACNSPCKPIQNQSASCGSTGCTRNCLPEFMDCDNNPVTGCETSLNGLAPPPPANCNPVVELGSGSINGDTAGAPVVKTGVGEGTFHIKVVEASTGTAAVTAELNLESPTGATYDMFVSTGSCGGTNSGPVASSNGVASTVVCTCDFPYLWDDYEVWVEVVLKSGASCSPWTLTLTGNVASTCSSSCF